MPTITNGDASKTIPQSAQWISATASPGIRPALKTTAAVNTVSTNKGILRISNVRKVKSELRTAAATQSRESTRKRTALVFAIVMTEVWQRNTFPFTMGAWTHSISPRAHT